MQKVLILNKSLQSTVSPNIERTYGPDSKVSELECKPCNVNMGKYRASQQGNSMSKVREKGQPQKQPFL